ncbi:MAG TPA: hypothetical protein VFJ74_08715, partial [Gemmatimonadaceae bacterium]|nr:hypothetical protein [Gemmatimonadaceae bacterium]
MPDVESGAALDTPESPVSTPRRPRTPRVSWRAWVAAGRERVIAWFNARQFSEHTILLTFAVATGVLSALGVVLFYRSIDLAYDAFYRWPATFLARLGFLAYRPIVTGAGLALAWWVMHRIGRGHDGINVPDVQLAVV